MTSVTELGYIGLNVSDLDAWKSFAQSIVGMELVDGESDSVAYLRMDHWHHRIMLHRSDEDDLAYMGWRTTDAVEFETLVAALREQGFDVRIATTEEARERKVLGLAKLDDPGGNPTEIFYGPLVEKFKPFHPGRPMFGKFVTGDQGLGHCILRQNDVAAATKFYRLLGFAGGVEYQLPTPDGQTAELTFMSVNERQHSVAFGFGEMEKRINHLMLEYNELDDLGLAHDIVRKSKIDVALQLGKHSNDEALGFYCATPSGWLLELGWGARKSQRQQEYYTRDVFGHAPEAAGYGVDVELN